MTQTRKTHRSLPVLPTATAPRREHASSLDLGGGGIGTPPHRTSGFDGLALAGWSADANTVRVGLVTLGCDKNTVDSERIMGRLAGAGARVSADADGADVVVINTCGFIDVAKEESVDAILDAARLKDEGRVRAIVAVGCLVQRFKAELEAELPEVDLFLGLTEVDRLIPELRGRCLLPSAEHVPTMERPLRVLSTATAHTSYLKVSEGCDHSCAFCAIPLMRGKHRSTPIEALVREARELESAGVLELNLVSQDTTWYGRDLLRGGEPGAAELFVGKPFRGMAGLTGAPAASRTVAAPRTAAAPRPAATLRMDDIAGGSRHGLLPTLLRSLLDATSIPWLRLFYMYPSGITRELVSLMGAEPRLLPYLDMPIQHGSDAVLRAMRRPERRATILERVGWLRAAIPDLVLRTTVIVGFPGERDEDVEAMLELLEEIKFDHLGAFAYSMEQGTRAAEMPDHVPAELARERLERVLDLQRAISLEQNERWVGRETKVLVDHVDADGSGTGRTAGQALEVDGLVRLGPGPAPRTGQAESRPAPGAGEAAPRPAAGPTASLRGPVRGGLDLRPGAFVLARIMEADERDLTGVVLGSSQ